MDTQTMFTVKLIEDDECRGRGRRPSPIHYVVTEEGCWRVVNRALGGDPNHMYPVIHLKGKQVSGIRFFYVLMGNELRTDERLYSTCGNSWCVNPEHHRKEKIEDVLNG